jgi:hypothetical protein
LWPKSHRQRNSHRKAWDNNKLWPTSHREGMQYQKFEKIRRSWQAYVLVKDFLCAKKCQVKVVNRICNGLSSHKRPRGYRFPKANIHKLRWLKQLKVAISTQASVPSKQSCRLMPQFLWFQN